MSELETTVEAAAPKAQKPSLSDVLFPINDLISFRADLLNVHKDGSKDLAFKNLCPDCDAPNALSSRYHCAVGHGPFETWEVKKGRVVGEQLIEVSAEQIDEAKAAELPPKVASVIQAFPSAELDRYTITGAKSYKLRVSGEYEAIAAAFLELLHNTEVAYVTEFAMRSVQKMYRLRAYNGEIIAHELVRPADLYAHDAVITGEVSKKNLALLDAMLEIEPFDPTAFEDKRKERVAALDTVIANAKPAKKGKKAVEAQSQDDLTTLLEAALKASKKKAN